MSKLRNDLKALEAARQRLAGEGAALGLPLPSAEELGLSYWIIRMMDSGGQVGSARRIAAASATQARAKHDRIYGSPVSNDPSFRVVVERDRSGLTPGPLHAERNPRGRRRKPGSTCCPWRDQHGHRCVNVADLCGDSLPGYEHRASAYECPGDGLREWTLPQDAARNPDAAQSGWLDQAIADLRERAERGARSLAGGRSTARAVGRNYTMSFAEANAHVPANPERTTRRSGRGLNFDVTFKVWPSRDVMARAIRKQEMRPGSPDDWTAVIPLRPGEGF